MKALQRIAGTNRARTPRISDLRPLASAPAASRGIGVVSTDNNKTATTIRNSNSITIRCFSSEGGSTVAFDRNSKRLQRDSAARAHNRWDPSDRVDYDYFRQEIAHRLVDRLDDIKREEGFPLALDIGKQLKNVSGFPPLFQLCLNYKTMKTKILNLQYLNILCLCTIYFRFWTRVHSSRYM